MKRFLKLSSNTFFQGGILLTGANFLIGGLNYVFNLLAGRALGPTGYGEVVALFSYTMIASIPVTILTTLLIQKIGQAEDMKAYAYAVQQWTIAKMKKWWFIVIFFLIPTPFIPQITNLTPIAGYVLPILILMGLLGAFYNGALQGLHLFLWFSIAGIIAALIKLSGAILVFTSPTGLETVIVCIVLSGIVQIAISHRIFMNELKNHQAKHLKLEKRIRDIFKDRQLWYTAGAVSTLTLINNVDIIFVKLMYPADQAGFFGAWALLAKIIFYALGPLLGLSYIFFSNKKQELQHHMVFIISFILFIVLGFIANMAYGLFGRMMVEMLFGKAYLEIVPFVEWASLFGAGYVLMMFMMNYFLAKKSAVSLVPAILFPIYLIALLVYPKGIGDVMLIDILYTFSSITVFLLVFFKNRLTYLISLFRN